MDGCSSDEALILATGRGDLQAFAEVVRRHEQWAWRIAHRFLGDDQEAADMVQEAFLRILTAAGRYRSTAKFKTYFYRVITRLCMDRAKKKQPCFMETIPEFPDIGAGAVESIMQEETALLIRAALDGLSSGQRMAVVLRYYEGLPYKEIALSLDTTPKAVERVLYTLNVPALSLGLNLAFGSILLAHVLELNTLSEPDQTPGCRIGPLIS